MGTRSFNQELIWEGETASVEHTVGLGCAVGKVVGAGAFLGLSGELGAGKTQFVRGLAQGVGADPSGVSSPTYLFVQEYESAGGGNTLVHVDAYRLMTEGDLDSIGWSDFVGQGAGRGSGAGSYADAIVVVEWAERISEYLPARRMEIRLEHLDQGRRHVACYVYGEWADREVAVMKEAIEQADAGFQSDVADASVGKQMPEATTATTTKCPICGGRALTFTPDSPFCSARCKTIDLGRWASGSYVISRPIEHSDLDEGE